MNKILLLDDEPEQVELVASYINEEMNDVEVLKANTMEQAIDFLEEDDQIIGILSDYQIHTGKGSGSELFSINKQRWNKPFLFLTGHEVQELDIDSECEISDFVIHKPFDEVVLIEAMHDVFYETNKIKLNYYKKVRASLLRKYLDVKANVYVRLGDRKYVKILSETDTLNADIIEKYELRGKEFLYLERSAYEEFISKAHDRISQQIEHSHNEGMLNVSEDVLDYVHEGIRNFGIQEDQIQLVKKCVKKCVRELGLNPSLKYYLGTYLENEDYLVYHSILALHLSYMMAMKVNYFDDWILEKLTYASILHDIMLPDSKLSAIMDRNTDSFESLTNHEKKIVVQHPSRASQLITSLDFLPREISNIVHEHHERPDGSGFPRGLTADKIAPLSCLFIIALQGADYFFHLGFEKEHVELFINHLDKHFDEGNFRLPKDVLVKLLRESENE
jgi:response regulator RpfG family c-di-GMP phosphodiesterase